MGEAGEGDGEAAAGVDTPELFAKRIKLAFEREMERAHGQLLEELQHLRTENARLESDNRKLRIKDEAIEETLRQLRQGTHAIYYDANGVRRTFAEVAG